MNKKKTIYFVNVFVILMPFLGFPEMWKNLFFVFAGFLTIIIVSNMTDKDLEKVENKNIKSYTENGNN